MAEHLALPLRLNGDHLATVVQDSDDDISQCMGVILSTKRGHRIELPGFGVTDPTFTTTIDAGEIVAALTEWEPRAPHVRVATSREDDEAEITVTISRSSSP